MNKLENRNHQNRVPLSPLKIEAQRIALGFFVRVRQELAPVRTCTKKAQKAGRPLIFNLFRYAPPQAVRDVAHTVRQIPETLSLHFIYVAVDGCPESK